METLSVCIHGASGYTGAECLRWVLNHPRLRLVGATAQKAAGKPLGALWPRLGHAIDLIVSADPVEADAHLLCLPHGQAVKLAPQLSGFIVDLSGDHRVAEPEHSDAYGFTRDTPPWLYGLPELGHARYAGHTRVANPGCFATALALALLPMSSRLPPVVHATGLTGSTGSGVTPTETTHHPARDENLRPYKVLSHQHVPEVLRAIAEAQAATGAVRGLVAGRPGSPDLQFVPISAPLRRGILVSIPLAGADVSTYAQFYAGNPLVLVSDQPPDLLSVAGTPLARIGVVRANSTRSANTDAAVVFCAIDNLARGAGSQAVANLNLLAGWPAELGLMALGPLI